MIDLLEHVLNTLFSGSSSALEVVWKQVIEHLWSILVTFGGIGAALTRLMKKRMRDRHSKNCLMPLLYDIFSNDMIIRPVSSLKVLRQVYDFDENKYADEKNGSTSNISWSLFEEWWRAFPQGFLCAYRNEVPVAVIGIFPVTQEWSKRFLKRQVSEFDLSGSIIRHSRGKHWYLSGFSSSLRPSGLTKHLPHLVGHGILGWSRILRERYRISEVTLVSEGSTKVGQDLLNLMGFELAAPAFAGSDKPRFLKSTDLAGIERFLAEEPLFKNCVLLRQASSPAKPLDAVTVRDARSLIA